MNKKLLLPLLCLLINASLLGEGFVSNTLIAVSPGALQPMSRICAGFDAYSLNEQGEMALARIAEMETKEKYMHSIMTIEGGTEICADCDQLFYCPNRNTWVKLVELNEGKDSVFSYAKKKPLRVLSIKKFRTALFNATVPIYRISLDKYGVYFATKDLILVHNFLVFVPTIGATLLAHVAEAVLGVGCALVGAYVTEKVYEKLAPKAQDFIRSSPKIGDVGTTPAVPKIDSDKKENTPPGTPPPDDGGGPGPGDIAKTIPLIKAEEEIRKNGEPAVKAAGNAVSNVVNTVKNALPGQNAVQVGLQIDTTPLTNPGHNDFKHIFGVNNGKWGKHHFDKIGKTASEIGNELVAIIQRALASGKLPSAGEYRIRDVVSGHTVEIRGKIVNGTIRIGTAFVDQSCC